MIMIIMIPIIMINDTNVRWLSVWDGAKYAVAGYYLVEAADSCIIQFNNNNIDDNDNNSNDIT